MSLNFNNMERRYIDVPAPYFGDEVVIRVNRLAVKHYVKSVQLSRKFDERKDISESDKLAYIIAASLIAVCTLPDSGQFAFDDSQIDDLVNKLPPDLFEALSAANHQLNQVKTDSDTLSQKKSES